MPFYNYTGRAKDGTKLSGEMEARSADDIAKQLKSINVYPLTIKEKKKTNQPASQICKSTLATQTK